MIAEIETALVNFISGCLPDEVDVAPAPGDWDDSYVRNLLTDLPAVRIVFDGGAQETPETFISLESRWIVFVAVGWKGGDEASRRTGAAGAFSFLDVLVPALHKAKLKDPAGQNSHACQRRIRRKHVDGQPAIGGHCALCDHLERRDGVRFRPIGQQTAIG